MLGRRLCAARWQWRLRVARHIGRRYGCSGDAASAAGDGSASANAPISVYSREDGSGTRGAFVELFGIEQKDANGDKVDMTTPAAAITNSTAGHDDVGGG